MLFSEIVGQQAVKERLIGSVNEGRISHAQLFLGPEGAGALALALAYAQYILCENKSETDSCGACPACLKNNKMAHPDVHYAFPVATTNAVKTKPVSDNFIHEFRTEVLRNPYLNLFEFLQVLGIENKQGNIGVEESSEILRKLNLKSYEANYKVMIIWMAEKMNPACANKLLKILEEPPEKTLFILVSESQDALLRTVLSRTQLVKINKLDDNEIANQLQLQHNQSDSLAKQIAHLANGNYNEALQLIQHEENDTFYIETFRTWMLLCYGRKLNDTIKWVDTMAPLGREVQKKFLSYAMRIIRESWLTNMGNTDLVKLTDEEKKFVTNFSKFTHQQNTQQLFEELNKAYAEIERNAAPRILFLDLSLRLYSLVRAA